CALHVSTCRDPGRDRFRHGRTPRCGAGRSRMAGMPDAPLRIAAVSPHTSPLPKPGGADAGGPNAAAPQPALALARAGRRAGPHVSLFARRSGPGGPGVVAVAAGVRVHHVEAGPAIPLAKSAMEQAIEPFRASLAPVLAAGDWDLVHSHHWFSGAAALPVAQKLGLPHLQSFHSVAAPDGSQTLDAGEPAESSGRIPGERYVSEHSDLVVAVSAAEARIVQERYGVPGERLAVVRPGVD